MSFTCPRELMSSIHSPGRRVNTSKGQIAHNLHVCLIYWRQLLFFIVCSFTLCFCIGTSGQLQIILFEYLSKSSRVHFMAQSNNLGCNISLLMDRKATRRFLRIQLPEAPSERPIYFQPLEKEGHSMSLVFFVSKDFT